MGVRGIVRRWVVRVGRPDYDACMRHLAMEYKHTANIRPVKLFEMSLQTLPTRIARVVRHTAIAKSIMSAAKNRRPCVAMDTTPVVDARTVGWTYVKSTYRPTKMSIRMGVFWSDNADRLT